MNKNKFMCDFLHIIIYIFVWMWCVLSLVFPFLWCMAYELILGEMYVVCIEFDVSGVTCDWTDYNINK
jgi:hypothetical protein